MFKNRKQAGTLLAQEFKEKILSFDNIIVLAVPRGGVPVAFEIAKELELSLDIFSVKKVGAPDNPELALGAVTEEGELFLNYEIIKQYRHGKNKIKNIFFKAQQEAQLQGQILRGSSPPISLRDRNVVLVDDGIATGATINAVVKLLRQHQVNKILLAVPVCSRESWLELNKIVDDFYVLDIPIHFSAVGKHYEDFSQVSNKEVISLLSMSLSFQRARKDENIDRFENEGGLIHEGC